MFEYIQKQYPEKFTFLIIFKYFTREFGIYLKKQATFQHIPLFCMFVNKHFIYLEK